MNDPIALQAELDAYRDVLQTEIARATRKLTAKVRALEVELDAANAALAHFRCSKTEPAPPCTEWPCSDSLPSPRDALPTIEWDSSAVENLLPEAS